MILAVSACSTEAAFPQRLHRNSGDESSNLKRSFTRLHDSIVFERKHQLFETKFWTHVYVQYLSECCHIMMHYILYIYKYYIMIHVYHIPPLNASRVVKPQNMENMEIPSHWSDSSVAWINQHQARHVAPHQRHRLQVLDELTPPKTNIDMSLK